MKNSFIILIFCYHIKSIVISSGTASRNFPMFSAFWQRSLVWLNLVLFTRGLMENSHPRVLGIPLELFIIILKKDLLLILFTSMCPVRCGCWVLCSWSYRWPNMGAGTKVRSGRGGDTQNSWASLFMLEAGSCYSSGWPQTCNLSWALGLQS